MCYGHICSLLILRKQTNGNLIFTNTSHCSALSLSLLFLLCLSVCVIFVCMHVCIHVLSMSYFSTADTLKCDARRILKHSQGNQWEMWVPPPHINMKMIKSGPGFVSLLWELFVNTSVASTGWIFCLPGRRTCTVSHSEKHRRPFVLWLYFLITLF